MSLIIFIVSKFMFFVVQKQIVISIESGGSFKFAKLSAKCRDTEFVVRTEAEYYLMGQSSFKIV